MAKPTTPVTARGEQTRQNLLAAAEQEFGEKGFHTASISSITQRAGVAQGTFYIYFASKEDILRALVRQMGRKVRHSLTEATEAIPNRLEQEKHGLEHFLKFAVEHKNLYRIVLESQFIDESIHREYFETLVEMYAARLKKAQESDQIRKEDPFGQAWVLMGISYYLGLRYAMWEHRMPPDEVVETAKGFIERGLRPD